MAPPKVRFLTKIYHPNIGACGVYRRRTLLLTDYADKLGRICLDILKGALYVLVPESGSMTSFLSQINGPQHCRSALSCFPSRLFLAHRTPMTLSQLMSRSTTKRTRRMPSGSVENGRSGTHRHSRQRQAWDEGFPVCNVLSHLYTSSQLYKCRTEPSSRYSLLIEAEMRIYTNNDRRDTLLVVGILWR